MTRNVSFGEKADGGENKDSGKNESQSFQTLWILLG